MELTNTLVAAARDGHRGSDFLNVGIDTLLKLVAPIHLVLDQREVRHGPQGNEIKIFGGDPGSTGLSVRFQDATERRHKVESNADARQVWTAEFVVVEIRIQHGIRLRQFRAG